MGDKLAEEVGAVSYGECSAKTKEGLKKVFETVVAVSVGNTERKRSTKHGWKTKSLSKCVLF